MSIEDDLIECGDKLCPVGTVCLWSYDRCATPEQVDACRDVPTGNDCSTTDYEKGGCFEGACLRRGCGNGFIEPGEVCDDANERSLDGCSSDCRSNETCGNTIRDPGEDCDDGGLLSRDGCDSRCLAEVESWREVPLGNDVTERRVADDESRQRLVSGDVTRTWEFVDDAWQSAPGAPGTVTAPYYDSVRNQVVAFVQEAGFAYRAMAWSGTAWTPASELVPETPSCSTFDRARGTAVAWFGSTLKSLGTDGEWSTYAPQPNPAENVAFDPGNSDLLVFSESNINNTLHYFNPATDSTWTAEVTPFSSVNAYGVDGTTFVLVSGTKIYRRTATGWQTSAAEDLPSVVPGTGIGLVYRRGTVLVVERGYSRCRRTTSWSCTSNPSNAGYMLAQDGDHQMRVVGGPYSWPVDVSLGARTSTASMPTGFNVVQAVYSAGRDTMVATGTTQPCSNCLLDTSVLEASGWTRMHSEDVFAGPLLYNPEARGVVHQFGLGGSVYRILHDDGTTFVDAGIPEGPSLFQYLAWDARRHNYVGLQEVSFTSFVYDLTPNGWVQDELAPVGSIAIEERSGGIVVIPPPDQNLFNLWERRGTTWSPRLRLPYEASYGGSAYESDTGRLWVIATYGGRRVAFVHEYTSPTPLETCTDPNADLDGDGLVGHEDEDCYWAPGSSRCQPFVNCPVPI